MHQSSEELLAKDDSKSSGDDGEGDDSSISETIEDNNKFSLLGVDDDNINKEQTSDESGILRWFPGLIEEENHHNSSDDHQTSDHEGEVFCSDDYDSEDDVQIAAFEREFSCYPLSGIDKYSHVQDGNKIIMPSSALESLVDHRMIFVESSPMVFEIKNPDSDSGRVSHCGVLEFMADEGTVLLPDWMMRNLHLQEGQLVSLKSSASLPKGTYMKIQPHTTKFFTRLSNPKYVLENTLWGLFSCLTVGDTIPISHQGNLYYVDILETKPGDAISVVDTDIEVEFAQALDYTEPEKKQRPAIVDHREEEHKFRPFTGVARRLDGKPPSESASDEPEPDSLAGVVSHSNLRPAKPSGRLVKIGSEASDQSPRKTAEEVTTTSSKRDAMETNVMKNKDQQKFQPFTGKKYTLAG